MREQRSLLKELQSRDLEIFRLESELEEVPQRISAYEEEIRELNRQVKQAKEALISLQKEIARKEMELAGKEEKIARLILQQNKAQTNVEYSALQKEIEGEKGLRSQLEDEVLMLMSRLEESKVEKERLGKEAEAKELKVKMECEKLRQRQTVLMGEIERLKVERRNWAEKLRIDIGILYDRILSAKHDRRAIAAVRNGICSGCSMALTVQEVAAVRTSDEPITCKHCGRILYWE